MQTPDEYPYWYTKEGMMSRDGGPAFPRERVMTMHSKEIIEQVCATRYKKSPAWSRMHPNTANAARYDLRQWLNALTAAGFKLAGPDEVVVPRNLLREVNEHIVAWSTGVNDDLKARLKALQEIPK